MTLDTAHMHIIHLRPHFNFYPGTNGTRGAVVSKFSLPEKHARSYICTLLCAEVCRTTLVQVLGLFLFILPVQGANAQGTLPQMSLGPAPYMNAKSPPANDILECLPTNAQIHHYSFRPGPGLLHMELNLDSLSEGVCNA